MKNFNWPMAILMVLGLLILAALGWLVVWVLSTVCREWPVAEAIMAIVVAFLIIRVIRGKK